MAGLTCSLQAATPRPLASRAVRAHAQFPGPTRDPKRAGLPQGSSLPFQDLPSHLDSTHDADSRWDWMTEER